MNDKKMINELIRLYPDFFPDYFQFEDYTDIGKKNTKSKKIRSRKKKLKSSKKRRIRKK